MRNLYLLFVSLSKKKIQTNIKNAEKHGEEIMFSELEENKLTINYSYSRENHTPWDSNI